MNAADCTPPECELSHPIDVGPIITTPPADQVTEQPVTPPSVNTLADTGSGVDGLFVGLALVLAGLALVVSHRVTEP